MEPEKDQYVLGLVVIVAIVTAVVVTLLQLMILGHSSAAITGGVVGAITAMLAYTKLKKKP